MGEPGPPGETGPQGPPGQPGRLVISEPEKVGLRHHQVYY